ncbi:MAG: helix-turn-helix domain-containing protein [Erysipelotrichaceae bacterium]
MKNYDYKKDTDFIKDNLLFNYCLWDDNAHLIDHFIHNNDIELNFDLDHYYFCITAAHKIHSHYNGSSGLSERVIITLDLLSNIHELLNQHHFQGNVFLIKVDNSKQIGIIFSKNSNATLSAKQMTSIIDELIMQYFIKNNRHVATSLSSAYAGYEGIHQAYQEARTLNNLSFFVENHPIFTKEYVKSNAIECGLISMNASIMKLRSLLSFASLNEALNELSLITDDLIRKSLNYRYYSSFFINMETIFEMFNEVYYLNLPIIKNHKNFYKLHDYKNHVEHLIHLFYQMVPMDKRYSPDIINILSYIHINYANSITLKTIGEYLDVNPTYISSKFNHEVGCSFPEYLHQQRIKHAKDYLKNTNMKIQDISLKVGYTSYKYFSEIFFKVTNMTPKQYREQNK